MPPASGVTLSVISFLLRTSVTLTVPLFRAARSAPAICDDLPTGPAPADKPAGPLPTRADLIDLEQQGTARLMLNGPVSDPLRIGTQQVITQD